MFTMQGSIWRTMLLHLLAITLFQFPNLTTSTKLTQLTLTLNLTHTLSPFAPLYDLNMSTFRNDTSSLEDIRFPLTRTPDLMLTVPVTLGTPPISVMLLMDTGSSLTWTQCQPCKSCYKQRYPIYDSRASKTFRKLPCDATCRNAQFKCFQNDCIYQVLYGGGAIVKGFASSETFYFSNGASATQVPNIIFGCSNEIYKAGPISYSGLISGIMGLSRSPQSLLTQLFPQTKRRFSYCFSPFTNGQIGTNTVMRFGDDVPTKTPTLQTPFRSGFSHYHLDLLDISVGNSRLRLSAGTFAPSPKGGVGGFIIDSGTLLPIIQKKTSLFPWGGGKPYTTVIGAFEKHYNALGLKKTKSPPGMVKLDLCYRKPAGFNKFATMTYHFKGADYVVDGKYTIIVDEKRGIFCVAVMPRSEVSVLGTWHQQNMRLVYDVSMGNGMLRFGAEDCAQNSPQL